MGLTGKIFAPGISINILFIFKIISIDTLLPTSIFKMLLICFGLIFILPTTLSRFHNKEYNTKEYNRYKLFQFSKADFKYILQISFI